MSITLHTTPNGVGARERVKNIGGCAYFPEQLLKFCVSNVEVVVKNALFLPDRLLVIKRYISLNTLSIVFLIFCY